MPKHVLKIVSGGQTGVDRAALDAAIAAGVAHGGYCPKGRLAEDGTIPAHYQLSELASPEPLARTRRNVIESDGTLILGMGPLAGGTRSTLELCERHRKPYLLLDARELCESDGSEPRPRALEALEQFVAKHRILTLNVAGPRASEAPEAYRVAHRYLASWLGRAGPARLKPG